MYKEILIILLLFTAVILSYSTVFDAQFVWDDELIVFRNPLIRAPLYSFQPFKQDIINSSFVHTIYYRPIQIMSYAVDYRLWGFRPFAFHFSNVLLHFLNTLLVFFLTRKLITARTEISFLTALLFAIHPAFLPAVSYISGRADLLFFFFGFISIYSFILFIECRKYRYLIFHILSLTLSLLSKEMAIILPFVLLFISIIFLIPRFRFNLLWHAPSFILAGIYGLAHHFFFAERYARIFKFGELEQTLTNYFRIAGELLSLAVLPLELHMRRSLYGTRETVSILIVAVIIYTAAYVYLRRYRRILVFALGFFFIAVVPLIFVVKHFNLLGEHWLYMSGYGVLLGISAIFTGAYYTAKTIVRSGLIAILCGLLIFYAATTVTENRYWATSVALSDRVLEFSSHDDVALYYKVFSYLKSGDNFDMDSYVKTNPSDPDVWYLKGRSALIAGNADEARHDFERILEMDRNNFYAFLGLALVELIGNSNDRAIEYLERAGKINPKSFDVFFLESAAYAASGKDEEALHAAKTAYKINPYDYNALINLGTAYARLGYLKEAAQLFFEAGQLYPEKASSFYNLGKVFYMGGEIEEAKECLKEAIMIDAHFLPAKELLQKINSRG